MHDIDDTKAIQFDFWYVFPKFSLIAILFRKQFDRMIHMIDYSNELLKSF